MPLSPTTSIDDSELSRAYKDAGRRLDRLAQSGVSWSGNERNCVFLNTGAGRFANVSSASGFDFADDGRSLALVDWDHDGDLDIWAANRSGPRIRFLRNETTTDHHFVEIQLQGTVSNRDGIGARIELSVGQAGKQQRLIKTLRAGEGFLGQSTKWLHFGLGHANQIESLNVRWPSGQVETFAALPADHRFRIIEGSGQPELCVSTRRELRLAPSVNAEPQLSGQIPVVLKSPVPLPRLEFRTLDGESQTLDDYAGQPVLLNLWASWCEPCVTELRELTRSESELQQLGLRILALSVDSMDGEPDTDSAAIRLINDIEFLFPSGFADSSLVEKLQIVHDSLFKPHRPLPLPASVLIDAEGRLAAIYKGPVSVERLKSDVAMLSLAGPDLVRETLPFKGHWQAAPRDFRMLPMTASYIEEGFIDDALQFVQENRTALARDAGFHELLNRLGTKLLERKDTDGAIELFNDALKLRPEDADGFYNLGIAMSSKGELDLAVNHYLRAIALDPAHGKAINNLANVYVARKQFDQAENVYLQALQAKPGMADIHHNLGALYLRRNLLDQAKLQFENALELNPAHAQAHNNLGILLAATDMNAAISHYRKATQLDSSYAQAHNNLATSLASQGKLNEAIGHYRTSVSLQPTLADAHVNLARALALGDDFPGAVTHLRLAIDIEPSKPNNIVSLAWILATHPDADVRNHGDAILFAERAARLTDYQNANVLDTLAAAYAAAGRYEDAVKFARQSIELLDRDGSKAKSAPIRERLELYQQGRPYRQSVRNRTP